MEQQISQLLIVMVEHLPRETHDGALDNQGGE